MDPLHTLETRKNHLTPIPPIMWFTRGMTTVHSTNMVFLDLGEAWQQCILRIWFFFKWMQKVYKNGPLTEINNQSLASVINRLTLSYPSFADDISLLTLYPSFLQTLTDDCYDHSINWRSKVDFNHYTRMNEREWNADKLYEYKTLGVTKNCISSSISDVNDNIEKTRNRLEWFFRSVLIATSESTYLCQVLEAGLYSISPVH